jgi:hypothetical protein
MSKNPGVSPILTPPGRKSRGAGWEGEKRDGPETVKP